MKVYSSQVKFVFTGTVKIRAGTAGEARNILRENFFLVMGENPHTSNEEAVKDWDFDTHPDLKIVSLSLESTEKNDE